MPTSTTEIQEIGEILSHVSSCVVTTDPSGNFELTVFVRNGITLIYMPSDNLGPLMTNLNFATYDALLNQGQGNDEYFIIKLGIEAIDWAHDNPPRDFLVNFYEFDVNTPQVSSSNYMQVQSNGQVGRPKIKTITYTHSAGERHEGREYNNVIPNLHKPGKKKPLIIYNNPNSPLAPPPIISKPKNTNKQNTKPKGK